MKRRAKILTGLAVLAALLCAGILFGQTGHHFFGPHGQRGLQAMAAQMPQVRRELFMQRMHQAMQQSRPLIREARNEQKAANALLEAEPFDASAYLAHMRKADALRAEVRQHMALAVADIAEQCDQQERGALAAALKQRYRKR
jgi:uncharacterized membrane protein